MKPATNIQAESEQNLKFEQLSAHRILLLGLVHALAIFGLVHFSWSAFFLFLVAYFMTGCLGLTVGYHRLLAHKSFRSPAAVRNVLALLGALTLQGGPSLWVAVHRAHHSRTDDLGDPHAAHRGFWWSHILWMLYRSPNGFRYSAHRERVKDVADTPMIRIIDRHYFLLNVAIFGLFFLLTRRLDWTLWVFPVRIVAFWHATWLVNSYAHYAGRSLRELSASRNSFWLSIIMFGEGWHENHHSKPSAASFQKDARELDVGFYSILILKRLGLADLKTKK